MRFLFSVILLVSITTMATPSAAKSAALETYGNVMQIALPAGALAVAAIKSDTEGEKQLARDLVFSLTITETLKIATDNTYLGRRPDKTGHDHSFPSGHTTAACAGSGFMGKRYGWEYGLPAFGLAALTGYSRVNAEEHHWRDVIAGCAISYAATGFFVTKEGEEKFLPVIGPGFIGFRIGIPFN